MTPFTYRSSYKGSYKGSTWVPVTGSISSCSPYKVSLTYSSGYPCSLSASMIYFFPPTGDALLMALGKGGSPSGPKILARIFLSFSKKAASPFCSPSCFTCISCFDPASPVCNTFSLGLALLPTDSNPTTSACLTTLSRG